jgi:hypothetical protein
MRDVPATYRHDITIFEAGGQVKIRPATVLVPTDNTLHVLNLCADRVRVVLPLGIFRLDVVPIDPGHEATLDVVDRLPGVYEYAVLAQSRGSSRLGQGESGPRVIID